MKDNKNIRQLLISTVSVLALLCCSLLIACTNPNSVTVDKSALETAITNAEALLPDVETSSDGSGLEPGQAYVSASVKQTFQTAIDLAKQTLNDTESSQAAVDAMVTTLNEAAETFSSGIRHVPGPAEADKDALASEITKAETLINSVTVYDGTGTEPERYITTEDKNTFQTAINAAKTIYNNTAASQDDTDKGVTALKAAAVTFENSIKTGEGEEEKNEWVIINPSDDGTLEAVLVDDPAGGTDKVSRLSYMVGSPVSDTGFVLDLAKNIDNFPDSWAEADGVLTVSYDLYMSAEKMPAHNAYIDISTVNDRPNSYHGAFEGTFGRLHFSGSENKYVIIGGKTNTTNPPKDTYVEIAKPADELRGKWVPVTVTVDLSTKKVFALKFGSDETVSVLDVDAGAFQENYNGKLYLKFGINHQRPNVTDFYFKNITGTYSAAPVTFAITPEGTGGTLSVSPNPARAGDTVTVIGTPNNGTDPITSVTAPGALGLTDVDIANTFSFTMPAKPVTVSVEFSAKKFITTPVYDNKTNYTKLGGLVSADKPQAANGETVTLIPAPYPGFRLKKYTLTGSDQTDYSNLVKTDGTFAMPNDDITVSAEFEPEANKRILYFTDLTYSAATDTRLSNQNGLDFINYVENPWSLQKFGGTDVAGTDRGLVVYTKLKSVTAISDTTNDTFQLEVYAPSDVSDPNVDQTTFVPYDQKPDHRLYKPETFFVKEDAVALGTALCASNKSLQQLPTFGQNYYGNTVTLTHNLTEDAPLYFQIKRLSGSTRHMGNYWYLILEYDE